MSDEIWQRDEPLSPCVKICVIHEASGLCTGCFRTREEITIWPQLSPESRQSVMAELSARAPQIAKRRGGRAGRQARAKG